MPRAEAQSCPRGMKDLGGGPRPAAIHPDAHRRRALVGGPARLRAFPHCGHARLGAALRRAAGTPPSRCAPSRTGGARLGAALRRAVGTPPRRCAHPPTGGAQLGAALRRANLPRPARPLPISRLHGHRSPPTDRSGSKTAAGKARGNAQGIAAVAPADRSLFCRPHDAPAPAAGHRHADCVRAARSREGHHRLLRVRHEVDALRGRARAHRRPRRRFRAGRAARRARARIPLYP